MWRTSQIARNARPHLCAFSLALFSMLVGYETLLAANIQCHFKAEAEPTEIEIVSNGKSQWSGTIDKQQTKTISVPEGPFIVISRIYNQNLKTKEDVRTETHTQQCLEHAALVVPLFSVLRQP